MKSAEHEILAFIRVIANHPDQVQVSQIEGNPVIFEVKACKEDLAELVSKEKAIQVIATSAGLVKGQFLFKFLEG